MVSQDQLSTILTEASRYLDQNSLLTLAQTSKCLHDKFAIDHLYHNIEIAKDPILRTDKWFLDGGKTYLCGYRARKKSDDQNDLFLYDRIERLLESSHLKQIKVLTIQSSIFSDKKAGILLLRKLIDKVISFDEVENLEIRDSKLFEEYYEKYLGLTNLRKVRITDTQSFSSIKALSSLRSLEWVLAKPEMPSGCITPEIKNILSNQLEQGEFVIDDVDCSSLRMFSYLKSEGVQCKSMKELKFNHVHGIHAYNKYLQNLTVSFLAEVIDLENLEKLEIGLSCEDIGCGCIDDFLEDLAPRLKSLRSLGLSERNSVGQANHKVKESWDIMINRFILKLPSVGKNLRTLSIRHNTPLNGLTEDSVHGNYSRRKTLYETVLPKLTSLERLIVPTMLQSLSAYEVLVCDLLWNGCECNYCQKVLPVFDQYIMNHQYYSKISGRYMDVIPTVFFAYAGDFLEHRIIGQVEWDIEAFSRAPISRAWNMHGYEGLHHFENYECYFDESTFGPLAVVISHFFNGYMDHIVQLLPSLRAAILSGIYYSIDSNTHTYKCIYD